MNMGRTRNPSHAPVGEEGSLSEGGGVYEVVTGGVLSL